MRARVILPALLVLLSAPRVPAQVAVPAGGIGAEDLEKASTLALGDHKLLFKLSQVYATAGMPKKAQEAILKALALEPEDPDYLRAAAQIATWNGDYAVARTCYERLTRLAPTDTSARLGLARVLTWSGSLDAAVRRYRAYTAAYPEEKAARLELAEAETWRGDYRAAMRVLEGYRKDFGETDDYHRQRALVLALAKRSNEALAILEPRLIKEPEQFMLRFADTIALANGRRPEEAVQSLDVLARLKPEDPLTSAARSSVLTPLKSFARAGFTMSHDSDGIDVTRFTLDASLAVDPRTQILVAVESARETAPLPTGLAAADDRPVTYDVGQLGIRHRISPAAALDASIGGAKVEAGTSALVYKVGADFNPSDQVTLRLERSDAFYAVSPRALSLGIRQAANQLQLQADMGLTWHVDALGGYDTYSDGNRRWELGIGPRAAVIRSQSFNVDLGARAWWFGFREQTSSGYYDPSSYQRYAATVFGYWKIDDNDGVSVMLSPGVLRDSTMDHFRFGLDASLEGTFGIYKSWMLVVRASHVSNNRVASGAYDGTVGQLLLSKRF